MAVRGVEVEEGKEEEGEEGLRVDFMVAPGHLAVLSCR